MAWMRESAPRSRESVPTQQEAETIFGPDENTARINEWIKTPANREMLGQFLRARENMAPTSFQT